MDTLKKYNIYLFISTFTRNIIDVYSVIYLYKLGIPIENIILIYAIIFFLGTFISEATIRATTYLNHKYILIFSSLISTITFLIIKNNSHLYLLPFLLSLSTYTYHPLRHYYGLKLLKNKKHIGHTLILIYLARFISSYIVATNIKPIYLAILSLISIIPILSLKKELPIKPLSHKSLNIHKNKLSFFIFEQTRFLFVLLEPLYLYLISYNISYVGYFNIIMLISSIICIYFLTNKINIYKNYKYINIIFTIILILKITINYPSILLIIAFFEGLGVKVNELISTINFYENTNNSNYYLIFCEKFFCLIKTIFLCLIYLFNISLKVTLYLFIIGIFFLSFQYKKDT